MSSIPMTASERAPRTTLTDSQIARLETELQQELRWLTGTTALEWLGQAAEARGPEVNGGARMHNRFHQVLDALDRIKNGTYGVCRSCHKPIPFRRLEIVPETTTCIACHPAASRA